MRSKATGVVGVLLAAAVAARPVRGGMMGMAGGGAPELTRVSAAFADAMRAGDAKAAAAVFAEDGTDMPPGSAPLRGRPAIEAYYRGLFGSCRFSAFELTETESRIAGDVAFLTGTSRIAIAGGPEERGKYLVVLERSGNGWKVAYAIHNSDARPAGAPGASR